MLVSNNIVSADDQEIDISLIVTTCNRPDVLQRFLQSILEQTCNKFEIILVNQGSPDKALSTLFEQHNWQLIEVNKQIPLSIARNIALQSYRGRLVGFPDDDCWYTPDFVESIIEKFDHYSSYEGICVSVFDPIKNRPYGNRPANLRCDLTFKNVVQLPVSVGIFMRTDIIKSKSIKFNENLGAGTFYGGGEETALLCSVLKHKGKVIYDGSLTVFHEVDDYNQISIEKVKKYSRGYGYIIGSILADKRYEVIPSILSFIIKSFAAMLIRSYKGKYFLMYATRIRFFFIGIFAAYKTEKRAF